ncbi:MAG: hypothetical protein ACYTG6_11690 [Planctomycetota bacterium]|jgi:hypothetical protein
MAFRRVIAPCLALLWAWSSASADAIVVTRAMRAETIAEIHVSGEGIRMELEIGMRDVEAFRNLLPDDLYARLDHPPEPAAHRLARFFAEDFVLRADEGEPLTGRLVSLEARRRVVRDEITGEALPPVDDEGEVVLFAVLEAPLAQRPAVLSIRPPVHEEGGYVAANVGFVTYHQGVAVNDFRYLGREEVLDLDWDDAWFSRFRNRNLRRRYDAPLSAFLYVDPFEVRQEIIVRPKDLEHWIDLGIGDAETIPVDAQAVLKQQVVDFLSGRNPLTIDGTRVEPVLDRIHFVRRTLRSTGIVDPPEALPVVTATLGVIFVHPIESLPERVTVDWTLFTPAIQNVPAAATDEAGGLPTTLTPDDPQLVWQNFLTSPTLPTFVTLEPPPPPGRWSIPVLSAILLGAAGVLGWHAQRKRRWRSPSLGVAMLLLAAGAVLLWPVLRVRFTPPFLGERSIEAEASRDLMTGLLRNVYHAFDYRGEEMVYDTLARSTSGELLSDVYLEMRRTLELQKQGGARVRVNEVEVEEIANEDLEGEVGFVSTCTWTAGGSVGHWGHIHQRRNRYRAVLTVRPVDGSWKITDLELLDEERL